MWVPPKSTERQEVMRFNPDPARLALGLVAAYTLASFLGGCYTVLKHPVAEVAGPSNFASGNCYECHSDHGPASPYDPMHVPGFDYYGDALYGYYAYPWWQRDVWYEDRYGYGGWRDSLGYQIPAESGSRTNLWGRGSFAPPPLPPTYTVGPGGGPTGATPPASGGGATPDDGSGQQEGRTMKHPQAPPPPPADTGNQVPPPPPADTGNQVTPSPPPTPGVTPPPPPPAPNPPAPAPNKDAKKDDKDKPNVWGRGGKNS